MKTIFPSKPGTVEVYPVDKVNRSEAFMGPHRPFMNPYGHLWSLWAPMVPYEPFYEPFGGPFVGNEINILTFGLTRLSKHL